VNPNTGAVADPSTLTAGKIGANGPAGLNVGTGCTDPALVTAMNWFDKNSTDVTKNGSVPHDADADFGATPQFFDPNTFYQSRGRRVTWAGREGDGDLSTNFRVMTGNPDAWSACYRSLDWKSVYNNTQVALECISCLGSVGWWRGPIVTNPSRIPDGPIRQPYEPPLPPEAYRKWVISGRILNLRPPKFVVARKVLKDVIKIAPNVRMGVASFGPDQGWFDPPLLLEPLRPGCNQSYPTINEAALDRPALMRAVDNVEFSDFERSIGEALFGLGGYFSSQKVDGKWLGWFQQPLDPGWGWPGCCNGGTYNDPYMPHNGLQWGVQIDEWTKAAQPWEDTDPVTDRKSMCSECQVSSVIVLTDGVPIYDNSVPITKMMQLLLAKGAKHPDGSLVTFNPTDPEHNPNVGGINYCDQFVKDEATGTKWTKADCDYTYYNWPTGLGAGNKNFMDDVAYFLANMDLRDDLPGTQSVRTYTIGYGDNSAMLQSIAMAGKGKFYPVNDGVGLRDAIVAALGDIKELSTSFAAANISGVQTGGQSSVYVPRFVPRRGRPYEGHLYRFFFYNEFAQGCDEAKAKSTAGDPHDLNHDQDCEDSFFMDKPAGFVGGAPNVDSFTASNIVQDNTDGAWVKVNTATPTANGKLQGGTLAQPFWDFGETLGKRSASSEVPKQSLAAFNRQK